jgi:hypothetical protein
LPPFASGPEKLSRRDFASSSNLPLFTTAIEKRTMNSAISSVIMSAYVRSQRSSACSCARFLAT